MLHDELTGRVPDFSADAFSASQHQKAQIMLTRGLNSLFLRALRSPACGWVVRTVIVSTSGDASPRADGRASKMILIR
ncbi:hypothetical protein MKK55_24855 [Methylobacterium sp. J-059]|uniref:hypothetical protein n=1 Tax=Methylobacterium sp. J-059 TaxID=2836643 RepID=UPI001FB9A29E|nr:hypothetical protein [Methylobacterium sp. J-059]MCJ2042161.1 hypothetical protein [Methylobacterium sp. J-059]